jgi:hypothetical protein
MGAIFMVRRTKGQKERRPTPDQIVPGRIVNDPLEPKRYVIKLPSGKQLKIKQKLSNDKGRWDTEMRESYLALIREGVTDKDAAAACGCSTSYFRKRRKADPAFEEAYLEARADGDDVIRAEVKRRGVDGVKRAIYHDGKIVGYKQEYSDQLLMFLAESRMPNEFGKNKSTLDVNVKFDGAAESLVSKIAGMLGIKHEPKMIDITPEDQ